MKTLATYSIKGGVGKTAAAVNLSYAAARNGYRTLVWDLDPQGAASFSFRIKDKVKGGAEAMVKGRRTLDAAIRGTDFADLDLVPADFSYRNLDVLLDHQRKPTRQLGKLLRPLRDDYDVVVLDCPPSISLASESVLEAADALLVPVIPTPLSLRTLEQLIGFVRRERIDVEVLAFFSVVDRRRRLHREVMDDAAALGVPVLSSVVPYSSVIEQVSAERAPVAEFAPRTVAARAFAELWKEAAARLWPADSVPGIGEGVSGG
jgi:chromosome partitioning protein